MARMTSSIQKKIRKRIGMKMMRVKRIRVAEVRKEQEARETNHFMLRAPWLLLVRCLGWWDGKPMKGN